jgi:hypothetical protein
MTALKVSLFSPTVVPPNKTPSGQWQPAHGINHSEGYTYKYFYEQRTWTPGEGYMEVSTHNTLEYEEVKFTKVYFYGM